MISTKGAYVVLDELTEESLGYIERSARLRRISCTRLLKRVLHAVIEDQLILSVLDDESKPIQQLPHERTKSHFNRVHLGKNKQES